MVFVSEKYTYTKYILYICVRNSIVHNEKLEKLAKPKQKPITSYNISKCTYFPKKKKKHKKRKLK